MWSAFHSATVACQRKEETVMKTDLVLTTAEYLAICCNPSSRVDPSGKDARHIPITAGADVRTKNETHGCRCDRRGHPHSCFTDQNHGQCATVQDFANREQRLNKMEYLIVIGVVAMMALYVVIVAGCLKHPEW